MWPLLLRNKARQISVNSASERRSSLKIGKINTCFINHLDITAAWVHLKSAIDKYHHFSRKSPLAYSSIDLICIFRENNKSIKSLAILPSIVWFFKKRWNLPKKSEFLISILLVLLTFSCLKCTELFALSKYVCTLFFLLQLLFDEAQFIMLEFSENETRKSAHRNYERSFPGKYFPLNLNGKLIAQFFRRFEIFLICWNLKFWRYRIWIKLKIIWTVCL